MCPQASGAGGKKYWLEDHDSDVVDIEPPTLNQWYTVFHKQDVRLLEMLVRQTNDETAAKRIEIRWIIDGNTYFVSRQLDDSTDYYIRRTVFESLGGSGGLATDTNEVLAMLYTDKRGLDFEVQLRITSANGTTQTLKAWCAEETLEET